MPLSKRWSTASKRHVTNNVPEESGVYELKSFGELVYIGKASNLRSRLLEHLDKNPQKYRYKTVSGGLFSSGPKDIEDKHLTRFEQKHGRLPKWNNNDTRG